MVIPKSIKSFKFLSNKNREKHTHIHASACNLLNRVLGTPTEEDWPNIFFLPQFKSSFPKFKMQITQLKQIMDNDETAYDLLKVDLTVENENIISFFFGFI